MSYYTFPQNCQIPRLSEFYEIVFGLRDIGYFVEIGAYNGNDFSNTSGLADLGWSGLYVEPVPAYADLCRQRHFNNKRVKIVQTAVSDHCGSATIFVGEALSTLVKEQVDDYNKIEWAAGLHSGKSVDVDVTTANALLENFSVEEKFDLLVVDVEGAEENVFASLDLNKWKPKVIIVELEDGHPDFKDNERVVNSVLNVRNKLDAANYSIVYKDNINSIYLKEDFRQRFSEERLSNILALWPNS